MKSLLVLIMTVISVQAMAFTSRKEFKKQYPVQGVRELVVSNRYGKVVVEQSPVSSISIVASIEVSAKSDVKAEEVISNFNVEVAKSNDVIEAHTEIYRNIDLKLLFSTADIQINYKVTLPKGIDLRIINSKGNVEIPAFAGNLNLDVQGGDVILGAISDGELSLTHKDGSVGISDVDKLNGDFTSDNVNILGGDILKLSTSSTVCTLGDIDQLTLDASAGTFKINYVEQMSGSASQSRFSITDVGQSIDMSFKWGELNIGNIHRTFDKIALDCNFTKVGLTFMKDAGYTLSMTYNKSVKVDLPPSIVLSPMKSSKNNRFTASTFVGNNKFSSKVDLKMNFGSLYIQ